MPTNGCMLGWYDSNGYTASNGLQAMETILDTHFAVVRIYHSHEDWGTVKGLVGDVLDDGRLPMVSHKPPKVANTWVAMARGDYDAQIADIVAAYKELDDKEIIVIFHHEPHDQTSDLKDGNYGTSADFVKAFRRFAKAFRDAGADNVKIGYCAVADFWANKGTPSGSADKCYPGSDYVDVLCHDEYNTWGEDGEKTSDPDPAFNPDPDDWDSMQEVMRRSVATAKAQNKPLIFGEIGSQHGVGSKNRDDWFRDGAAWIKSDTDARNYLLGFCYYHVDNHDKSGHWWRFAQGRFTDGKTGFKDGFSHDSYFLTQPIPVALRGTQVPGSDLGENSPSGGTPGYVRPTRWAAKVEATGSPYSEISGFAASPKGGAWVIRDSGNEDSLFWYTQTSRGNWNAREIPITGGDNRDFEDCIYVVEGGTPYIYVHDNRDGNSDGLNPKRLTKIPEPANPNTATSVSIVDTRHWKFPATASSSTCGTKQNCEAIIIFKGILYGIQKTDADQAEVYRIGAPSSLSTDQGSPTEGTLVGTIGMHCPSGFSIHADGQTLITFQHGEVKVFRGKGDTIESLLTGKNTKVFEDDPDGDFEGGDWYPYGSNDFVLIGEDRAVADYDATEGFAYGGGIPPSGGFGSLSVTLDSGALTVLGVGAIPSSAFYDPNEEEAGIDFGLLSVTEEGNVAVEGIGPTGAFGDLEVIRDEGFGYIFIPPIRYNQPLVPAGTRGPQRLFRYLDGIPVSTNVYVLIDGTVTEQQPWDQDLIVHLYFGGHETPVSDAEADVLVSAGYGANLTPILPPAAVQPTWDELQARDNWGKITGSLWGGVGPGWGDLQGGRRWSDLISSTWEGL